MHLSAGLFCDIRAFYTFGSCIYVLSYNAKIRFIQGGEAKIDVFYSGCSIVMAKYILKSRQVKTSKMFSVK